MNLIINGRERTLEAAAGSSMETVIAALELKGDRIAVEHNGEIAPRTQWPQTPVTDGDRLEIVHFVGGGCLPHGR